MNFSDIFSIQIFFIIFRETLETSIIISVLLSFINKREPEDIPDQSEEGALHNEHTRQFNRKLRLQVWLGAVSGLLICLFIGIVFVLCFYFIQKDLWLYTERLWEGLFSLISATIITGMGVGLLRINKVMKVKWWMKLGDAYTTKTPAKFDSVVDVVDGASDDTADARIGLLSHLQPQIKERFTEKYYLAILPFVTTLREGLEAVVFIGGIGTSQPPMSLPLAIACGTAMGASIGYFLYKGGNKLSLQYFLICSTCFLYTVSAGLMSRGVWFLELEKYVRACGGMDVSETGSGPGSYDIANTVWHVNCCNGLTDGWWMVANALVGWTNTATYGSVWSYIGYWVFVAVWLRIRLYDERHGRLPLIPIKWQLKRIRKKVHLLEMLQKQEAQQAQ